MVKKQFQKDNAKQGRSSRAVPPAVHPNAGRYPGTRKAANDFFWIEAKVRFVLQALGLDSTEIIIKFEHPGHGAGGVRHT
jgi:hypothetical protein